MGMNKRRRDVPVTDFMGSSGNKQFSPALVDEMIEGITFKELTLEKSTLSSTGNNTSAAKELSEISGVGRCHLGTKSRHIVSTVPETERQDEKRTVLTRSTMVGLIAEHIPVRKAPNVLAMSAHLLIIYKNLTRALICGRMCSAATPLQPAFYPLICTLLKCLLLLQRTTNVSQLS